MLRRLLGGFVALAAGSAPIAAAAASPSDPAVLLIAGRGWGHGVGLAQDGALYMGLAGSSVDQILGTFYPGARYGFGSATVRVSVLEPAASVVLSLPSGGSVSGSGSGFPISVPRG